MRRAMKWLAAGCVAFLTIPDWYGVLSNPSDTVDPLGDQIRNCRALIGLFAMASLTIAFDTSNDDPKKPEVHRKSDCPHEKTPSSSASTVMVSPPEGTSEGSSESKTFSSEGTKDIFVLAVGHAGHGKDTLCDYLVEHYGFEKYAYANPLKEATRCMFGFSSAQMYDHHLKDKMDHRWAITPRQAVNFVGTELVRTHVSRLIPNIGADFWIKRMQLYREDRKIVTSTFSREMGRQVAPFLDGILPLSEIIVAYAIQYRLAVSDGRFPNEIAKAKADGAIVVRVNRKSHAAVVPQHQSVTAIDQIPPEHIDVMLHNDGSLSDFYASIEREVIPFFSSAPPLLASPLP